MLLIKKIKLHVCKRKNAVTAEKIQLKNFLIGEKTGKFKIINTFALNFYEKLTFLENNNTFEDTFKQEIKLMKLAKILLQKDAYKDQLFERIMDSYIKTTTNWEIVLSMFILPLSSNMSSRRFNISLKKIMEYDAILYCSFFEYNAEYQGLIKKIVLDNLKNNLKKKLYFEDPKIQIEYIDTFPLSSFYNTVKTP